MRQVAVLLAAAAGWVLAGGAVPPLPRPPIRLRPAMLPAVVAAAITGFVVVLAVGGTPLVAGAIAVLAASVPPAVSESRRRARAEAIADRWPDVLAAVRSDLAAGRSVAEAVVSAGHRVGGAFDGLAGEIAGDLAAGHTFAEAAAAARTTWSDPVADRILTTLAAASVTGGDRVSSILGALASSVSDELRLRRAHDAALTQQRLTSAVALIAPWVLLILTTATNPQAAEALSTGAGPLIVGGGLAATGVGYLLARRAARLARPPRLFT